MIVWFSCLTGYQLLMGYFMLKYDTSNLQTIIWFQATIPT